MKNLENFKYLPIKEKAFLVKSEGKYLATIESLGLKISLYVYDGTYVEIFNVIVNDKLVAVRILDDKKRLSLYSRNIDLKILLNQSLFCFLFACAYYESGG